MDRNTGQPGWTGHTIGPIVSAVATELVAGDVIVRFGTHGWTRRVVVDQPRRSGVHVLFGVDALVDGTRDRQHGRTLGEWALYTEALVWREVDVTDDRKALDLIHAILDGCEWDADTTDAIAHVVASTGRLISEPGPDEDPDGFDDLSDDDGLTDVEADAMTLASAGMGTDEDYGYFGTNDD